LTAEINQILGYVKDQDDEQKKTDVFLERNKKNMNKLIGSINGSDAEMFYVRCCYDR
jgi:hypothetical protein